MLSAKSATTARHLSEIVVNICTTISMNTYYVVHYYGGRIECSRCRLLRSMIPASVSLSDCLSHGFTRLHCAKTAQRTEILFEVKIPVVPKHIVLDGRPDHLTARGERFDAAFAELLWSLVGNLAFCVIHYTEKLTAKQYSCIGCVNLCPFARRPEKKQF